MSPSLPITSCRFSFTMPSKKTVRRSLHADFLIKLAMTLLAGLLLRHQQASSVPAPPPIVIINISNYPLVPQPALPGTSIRET